MPKGKEPQPIPVAPHIWVSSGSVKARCIHCGRYSRKHYIRSLGYTLTTLPRVYYGNRRNHNRSIVGTPRLRKLMADGPKTVHTISAATGWNNAQIWSAITNLVTARMVTRYGSGRRQVFTLNQCGLRALAEDRRRAITHEN